MDRSPALVALWAQWRSPGDAELIDHLVVVVLRQRRREAAPTVRPWVLYACIAFVLAVLVATTWPSGLLVALPVALLVLLAKVIAPRAMAKSLRRQPTIDDPYTLTLDAEGLHVVSPSVADHLRWRVFESAALDEDVLLLRTRGTRLIRAIPLMWLDPAIDRAALVAEVERAIAADAPPA